MISFIGKTVESPILIIHTSGKKIIGKVVWKKDKFQVRVGKDIYDIDGWNDISECNYIYALPTNTFFTPWHMKQYTHVNDANTLSMILRYWGKYRHNMTIYGKIINNVFYPSK